MEKFRKLVVFFSLVCFFNELAVNLVAYGNEADPTLMIPETNGALVKEKEDVQGSKKSDTISNINQAGQPVYNYRSNRNQAELSRTGYAVPFTQDQSLPHQNVATFNKVQAQNGQVANVPAQNLPAQNVQNQNVPAQNVQSQNVQNQNVQMQYSEAPNMQSQREQAHNGQTADLQAQSQQANNVPSQNGQPFSAQAQNGRFSSGQTQNLQAVAPNTQTQNAVEQTQNFAGAGLHAHNDSQYSSISKALHFYENIVSSAQKLSKDSRGVQAITSNETVKGYNDNHEAEDPPNVCLSDECKKVADYIKTSMDESAEPCDDFYTFACGGWKRRNDIPVSENEITAFTKLTKKIENATHTLLLAPAEAGESEALEKARKFFYSCMNTTSIEKDGAQPALDFIKNISGWSMCGDKNWNEKKWNQYDVLKEIQSKYYPAPPFFTVEVTNDHLNSTKHLVKIDQSGLSLQREIYVKHSEIVEDYKNYMVQIVKLLGYNCNNLTEEVKEIIDFEDLLAKYTTPAEAKQAGTFRRINIKLLENIVPQFPWFNHLKHIFKKEATVSKKEIILATTPVYLYKIATLIKKTPKRILSKYIVWQMLRDKISFLSSDFRAARAAFNEKMTGVKDKDPRWRTCTGVTNDNMGVPIGTLYVNKYFKESTRTKTREMIDEIIKSFEKRIEKHDWIDKKTRKGILEKTASLVAKVGYATYILEPEELNKRFRKLSIGDSFFINNLNVDRWIRMRLFGKLRKPVDKSKWPMFPQTINAMYQFYENEIVIPAGILQAPFYYEGDVPRALSYGAIGSIIGHELTHGFDNTGRKFDKNGDIVKEWWSQSALKEFQNRASCIRRQYSKYKVQDKYPVSGKLTLGENIADNGGTKLAYDAYMDWLDISGSPEQTLPNLSYTNKQLFFIGYAQEYCANVRQKTEYIATLSEIHAPSKFRVIGTLSNFKQFSEAFKCGKKAPMNPDTKCEVW